MSDLSNIEFNNDEFNCVVEKEMAILTIKGNAFKSVASLERNLDIIPWFGEVEKSKEVRGILIFNEKNSMSEEAYIEFLKDVIGDEFNPEYPKEISRFVKSEIRAREINILSNLIMRIINFPKIVITGIHGDIVSPFFGLALVSDFRFVSSYSNFVLSHIKYKLHPSGALPFLLSLYLCHSKVIDILFRGDRISAQELKELGLVNDVFNEEIFIPKVIEEASNIVQVSLNVVYSTKKLLYGSRKNLEDYLSIESEFTQR